MRSDEGLKKLLDLLVEMSYSAGGAGFATVPPRNTYVSDHMNVTDVHAHRTGRLLNEDAWHVIDSHNSRLWLPPEFVDIRERKCHHHWLKVCDRCGARYCYHGD